VQWHLRPILFGLQLHRGDRSTACGNAGRRCTGLPTVQLLICIAIDQPVTTAACRWSTQLTQ
jgi:hypothetical protein